MNIDIGVPVTICFMPGVPVYGVVIALERLDDGTVSSFIFRSAFIKGCGTLDIDVAADVIGRGWVTAAAKRQQEPVQGAVSLSC